MATTQDTPGIVRENLTTSTKDLMQIAFLLMSDHLRNIVYVLQVEHLDSERSFSNPENNSSDHVPASGAFRLKVCGTHSLIQIVCRFYFHSN